MERDAHQPKEMRIWCCVWGGAGQPPGGDRFGRKQHVGDRDIQPSVGMRPEAGDPIHRDGVEQRIFCDVERVVPVEPAVVPQAGEDETGDCRDHQRHPTGVTLAGEDPCGHGRIGESVESDGGGFGGHGS